MPKQMIKEKNAIDASETEGFLMISSNHFYSHGGKVGNAHPAWDFHKNKGLTVIELLVGIVIIGCLAAIVAAVFWKFFKQPEKLENVRNTALQNLITFSKTAELKPIDCVSRDADNDGYVDCTAQDKKGQFINIECAYDGENQGCKVQKPQ